MSNYKRYFKNFNNPTFITIVTKYRRELLIKYIYILKESLNISINKFHYKFIAGAVLKDHCHLIISTEIPENIPKIIHDIKYNFSTNLPSELLEKYRNELTPSEQKRGEKGVWQRRYYDHIIRDENDFNRHLDYIHYNSVKHYNISPKDWEYSSFHKFVKNEYYDENWCNYGDKNNIINMELE